HMSFGPNDVDVALQCLAEPSSRLSERCWWFWDKVPVETPAAEELVTAASRENAQPLVLHDGLIVRFAWLAMAGESAAPKAWGDLLADAARFAESTESQQWHLEVEASGGYDKPATAAEIAACRTLLVHDMAATIAQDAKAALNADNMQRVEQLL